jgi:hypothetical protein
VLGYLAAGFDVAAPLGDDTAKGTLLLWLLSCGVLGFVWPRGPWRWALLVGPWVPAAHVVLHALALLDSMHPPTYATALALVAVSLVVCLLGAYAGSFLRRAVLAADAGAPAAP